MIIENLNIEENNNETSNKDEIFKIYFELIQ